jgi:homoserine dehydrogenase
VIHLLRTNAEMITARCGKTIEVVAASARDLTKKREVSLDGIRLAPDALSLANDPEIDVVVELIGGDEGVAKPPSLASTRRGSKEKERARRSHHRVVG